MDLQADKELPIEGFEYTDEVGNPVDEPAGVVETFTSDNPDVVSIVTADDGLLVARATGTLGTANVHGSAVWTDGDGDAHETTSDFAIAVVAGDAERATIAVGDPREITPDV